MGMFLRRILKLDSPITVGDWFYQRITGNWPWIFAAFSGAGMTYLAKISEWLQPWGPVGWASVGIFFAIFIGGAVALVYRLFAGAFLRIQHAKTMKSMSDNLKGVNPLRDSFENEKILISDFYTPIQTLYKRKTFRKCDFYGPGALIFYQRTSVISPEIYRSDFIVIGEGMFSSPIAFEDSSFYECLFYGITLLVNKDMAQLITKSTYQQGSGAPAFHGAPINDPPKT